MMGRLAVTSLNAMCGLLLVLESSAAAASVAPGGVIMQGAGAQHLTSNLGAWRSVQAGGALRLRGGGKKKDEKGGIKNCPQKATDNRLFIANLPAGLNDEGLFEAFEIFGEVEEARVMRDIETGLSRRMAYVSFKKVMEMDEALEEMHGSKICAPAPGSQGPAVCTKIEVHEAKPQKQTW